MNVPPSDQGPLNAALSSEISRRRLLQIFGVGAAAVGAGGLLAACTSDGGLVTPSGSASPSASAAPKKGGTLRIGIIGAGASDTMDPALQLTVMSAAASNLMYDSLRMDSAEGGMVNVLAEGWESNADSTSFVVTIKEGIEFHNGKPVTVEDHIYTWKRALDPATKSPYASGLASVDAKNIKQIDTTKFQIPLTSSFSILPNAATPPFLGVVPVGYDPKNPIGTGPYKYKSFTPGSELRVVRNDNYFADSGPYFDEIVVTAFPDEASMNNALIGGSIDVATGLTAASVAAIEAGGMLTRSTDTGGWTPIVMNMKFAPFDDPDVRTAFKLMVDRQQIIDTIWAGKGSIGNDLFGKFDPLYNADLPQREYDPEQAKALLKKAGKENLTVEFTTAPIFAGTVDLATVFAQQAKAAGVTVNIKKLDASSFFGDGWLSYPLTTDYWSSSQLLPITGQTLISGAPYPETGFSSPEYDALWAKVMKTSDESAQKAIVAEMQTIEWNSGGYIIPNFLPVLTGYRPGIEGIADFRTMSPLNRFRNVITMWQSS